MSANLCPFRAVFLILERSKNLRGLSEMNKVGGPFFNVFLSQELANT
jgi:hypothetical protein